MSIRYEIRQLHQTQIFVQQVYACKNRINTTHSSDITYDDYQTRQVALQWRKLIGDSYNFSDNDFTILIEEIFGELLEIMCFWKPAFVITEPPDRLPRYLADIEQSYLSVIFVCEQLLKVLSIKHRVDDSKAITLARLIITHQVDSRDYAKYMEIPVY